MNIYVSGPMTALPRFNFPAFDLAARQLRDDGHHVFSPADHDRETVADLWPGRKPEDFPGYADGDLAGYFDAVSSGGAFTLDNMLKADLDFITNRADQIVMLPGWGKSTGARYERTVAEALNVPIMLALEHEAFDGVEVGYVFVQDEEQKRLTGHLKSFVCDVEQSMEDALRNEQPVRSHVEEMLMEAADRAGEVYSPYLARTITRGLAGAAQTVRAAEALVDEHRVTNDKTGGQKGSKIERFDLIPVAPLRELAEMYGRGSLKYEDRNWEKGYDWSLSFAALQRHAWAFWSGEDYIPDTPEGDPTAGIHHLAAVAWHAFAMIEWRNTHHELDNRVRPTHPCAADGTQKRADRASGSTPS